eukprot:tig00000615_g2546.t1
MASADSSQGAWTVSIPVVARDAFEHKEKIHGDLIIPPNPQGLIIFAHGSGSSRKSPRNQMVSGHLNRNGFATLLVDLLTRDEEQADSYTGSYRFNIPFLARRLSAIKKWASGLHDPPVASLRMAYFGASTGAAAALMAAAGDPSIHAIVSRGGRPDLAGAESLSKVTSPVLLIVGSNDQTVLELNREAGKHLGNSRAPRLQIVPGATHLFEEAGALESVAEMALRFFNRHVAGRPGEE